MAQRSGQDAPHDLGDLLEHRALTNGELTQRMRENILQTYLRLAQAHPLTQVWQSREYTLCTGHRELSFCNFAAGFCLGPDRDDAIQSLHALKERIQDNRRFWLFHMAGDQPADLPAVLLEAGFVPKHGLVEMAWNPVQTAPEADLTRCQGDRDRIRVAEFMAGVFFWRLDREYRDQVARTTAGSGLELYRYEQNGKLVGALMLSLTERSIGLYNLCVEDSHRNHGLGSSLVRSVQAWSHQRGLPMLLQCDSSLQPWYAKLGFKTVGLLTAYGAPTR